MAAFATSSSPAASAVAAAALPKVFGGAGKTKGGSAGCRVGIARKNFGSVVMALAVDASRFEGVPMAPPDPILGVSEAFKADKSDLKLNLGVGAYRTEELQPAVLNVVKKAENLMLEKGENKEYLPIEGLAAFNKATAELLLGADNPVIKQGRVATLQSLSGTGSLRLAAAFIQRYFPEAKVIISSPTWGNHKNIFNDARVPWLEYRYYDPKTVGLDFEGMIADIQVIILYRAKILEEIAKSLKLVIHSERIAELQENRYRAWIEIDKLSANSSEDGNTEVYFGDAIDTEYEAREDIAETVIQAIISATCITMGDINW